MSFQEKYLSIFEVVKDDVEKVKSSLFDGIELDNSLKFKLFDILNAPSKHIRAVLTFLYLKTAGMKIDEKQIIYQSAIELVHNASLIHDDVIDESSVRRSVQTLNSKFGNKLAVITGDYLLSVALKKIRTLENSKIIDIFAQTLDDMCQGEIKQDLSRFKIPTIEEYLKKTELKTAKLFETALCGSFLLYGAGGSPHLEIRDFGPPARGGHEVSEEEIAGTPLAPTGRGCHEVMGEGFYCSNVQDFARNFGIAFQIRDDLINAKTSQNDVKDGIYTAPVIFAGSVDDYENGIEKTQILLNNYIESAQKEIEKFEESKYKTALTNLLGLIKNE